MPDGGALLVAGYGPPDAVRTTGAQLLAQAGEILLASDTRWKVRRLADIAGERTAPSRATLKRHIDELTRQPMDVALLVVAGLIVERGGVPALVTGVLHREYPEDTTLPLSWVRERLLASQARHTLLVLSGSTGCDAAAALAELATDRPGQVIAVDGSDGGFRLVEALVAGLRGEALDPKTGTITLESIGTHLARQVTAVALQRSPLAETVTSVPPLRTGLDARLSLAATVRPGPVRAADAPEDLTGMVLPGRFRLDAVLARGSFGVVYRARQLSIERDVAVKVLQAGVDASSEDGRLFVHEIQSVGRIDHAHVVRIFQADVTPSGQLFYAMELLEGRDLQRLLDDEGRLPQPRAVELTRQLLAGLGAVHAAGLVHADVKPANAFVTDERLVLVDFGLARLKPAGDAADSAGGTPAYMAPEQLHNGRVDTRSDLFSTALILVTLLTGWRRQRASDLVPPLDGVGDPALAKVLARALAVEPADRYQRAEDFADALAGKAPAGGIADQRAPFRLLASYTEHDRGRLLGRDRDLAALSEHVLFRRAVVFTAPSGVGKTSLLRAGLVPHLESLGMRVVYLTCRPGAAQALLAAVAGVAPGAGKLVLILDQLEAALTDEDASVVGYALALADGDASVVFSVREDFLARLMGRAQLLDEGLPIVRLGPLDVAGARAAIVAPLAEQRLTIAPDLLATLLDDLQTAAASLAQQFGWGAKAAVYPPHLQLACSILFEALGSDETALTLAHYRRLGGLEAIVGEHLDRVLDTELDAEAARIAREVFLALVTSAGTRAFRSEAELLDAVGPAALTVLESLRARGLLVRVRPGTGEAGWELVHDSLVPRVLAWIDRQDLSRRRAVELVRHHLLRSRPGAPSLLNRAELREVRVHAGAIAELDEAWRQRGDVTPLELVTRSRNVLRRQVTALTLAVTAVVGGVGTVAYRAQEERSLRDRDLGRWALELAAFDWDAAELRPVPVPVTELPRLSWRLHEPSEDDPDSQGAELLRGSLYAGPAVVEVRGGDAFLVVEGRGRRGETCAPSVVPLRRLPGYARRYRDLATVHVVVPTCAASRADMITVPAGPYIQGGVGDPPSAEIARWPELAKERVVDLPAFAIDRTEVTMAAFGTFADMAAITGIATPSYPGVEPLQNARAPRFPVTGVTWAEARAYCRFLGKRLVTAEQWEKAMRGGLKLPGGADNPMPRRALPWGGAPTAKLCRIDAAKVGPAPVALYADLSPYGVLGLAGNLQEWTDSTTVENFKITRGGNWTETTELTLLDFMAVENPRPISTRLYNLGARCASSSAPPSE